MSTTNETGINSLDFSFNWNNKLDCTFFTTLRLSGRFNVGEWVQVLLKSAHKGRAVVVEKKQLRVSDLNAFICGLDTGYSVPETKQILSKMYPGKITESTTIYLYLCRYEMKAEKQKREDVAQVDMFSEPA